METEQEDMMATKEMAVQDVRPAEMLKLTAAEIRADVNLIQEVLKAVMKKDVHYGIIPGTPKPTLYKPGAEKILMTFRLDAEPVSIEDLSTPDEIRYRVKMRAIHQITRQEIGWGVGECSSSETKYKWIAPICDAEFDETPEDRRRVKWMKKKDGGVYQKKQIRPNLQDAANTILKMAKKRALVDLAITCTGASDVFDQDIEDLPEGLRQSVADASRPPMPQRTTEKQTPAPSMQQPIIADENKNPGADDDNDSVEDPPAKPAQRRIIDLTGARNMAAKFEKPCKLCGKKFTVGQQIVWLPDGPDKGDYHIACANG